MFWLQPDFLLQFTVHGLLRRFAALDAALRKLPGVFSNALAPEDLVLRVTKDNADVRAIAFTVEHKNPAKINGCPNSFTKAARVQRHASV
jgi:hypothetical protein